MTDILDLLKRAIDEPERKSVTISLFGEEKTIWGAPIRGLDVDWLNKKYPKFATEPSVGAIVDLMIRRCQREDGSPMFDASWNIHLKKLDINILHKIREELFEPDMDVSEEAIDDEKKDF